MTEGQSATSASAPSKNADVRFAAASPLAPAPGAASAPAPQAPPPLAPPPPAPASPPPASLPPAPASLPAGPPAPPGPRVPAPSPPPSAGPSGAEGPAAQGHDAEAPERQRVDGRLMESAILALRRPIVAAALPLEAPDVEQARSERRKLLGQIDDYLLPRLRESGSPILVALVGSTGAGKSTLVNSLVGAEISMTGIRRPTTNSPVLACHPDDVDWFAENVFLPTVPRVRQEGLARSGRDGLLVLAASEGMPQGIALLDTPDIDSVVRAHRDFAHQFLDASDMWLFMTTAGRYADAAVWDLLEQGRDRGAALAIVLSRVPEDADEIVEHFTAMLEANDLGDRQRFLIPETELNAGRLPPEASDPVRAWLEETSAQLDRRVAVLTQTMSGMLDTFRSRVPGLAAHVETQVALRADLRAAVESAYRAALAEVDASLWDGSLLRGEVLADWQELAGTGDLLRVLQARRGVARQRHQRGSDRVGNLQNAVRRALESLIHSIADRAAEDAAARWKSHPAGAALLAEPAAEQETGLGAQLAADLSLLFGPDAAAERHRAGAGGGEGGPRGASALNRSTPDLALHAARAVSAWQDLIARLMRADNMTRRSIARTVSLDSDSLATVLMVALLGSRAPEPEAGTSAIPQRLLTTVFGAAPLREVTARAQADLRDRVSLIFEEEMLRFSEVLDRAETPDPAVAVQLYQATYSLQVVR